MFGSEQALGDVSGRAALLHTFFGHEHLGHHIRAMHLRRMLRQVKNPQTILDAGSGDGSVSAYLARCYPQARVLGVEVDREKVKNCQLILSRLGRTNLHFVQGDLLEYRPIQVFGLIVCIDVLEHIEDDQRVLDNLATSLRSGGQLIVHVPRQRQLLKHHFGDAHIFAMTWDHVRTEYTEAEILKKLTAAGFEVQAMRYTFGWFGSLSRETFYAVQRFGRSVNGGRRAACKGAAYPLLLTLAYLDTLPANKSNHQGFLIRACR